MATWQNILDWLSGGASQPALNQQPTTKQQPNGATGVVGGPQVGPVEHKYYYSDVGAAIRLGALVHGPGATELLGAATGHGQDANSAVFACLTVLCKAHIEAQPRVYQRHPEGGEDEVVANHPFELLMERPNPHMSGLDVQWWTQWARHVHGNAYWRKVRAGDKTSGNVIEYWPVSPVTIAPVTTKEDRRRGIFISYYKWEYETGKYENVPIENIVHFKFGLDDSDHRLGVSPLRRLIRHAMGDDAATRFAASLLDNYAVPGMVVTTDADLDENDADEVKRKLSMRFGSGQQGNVAVLTSGMTAAPFGFSPEQLDLKMLHRLPEERIAAVMGVPAVIAGLGAGIDKSIYNNYRESREAMTEQTILPMYQLDAAALTLQALPDFTTDRNLHVKFDISNMRGLQEDEDRKYARLSLAVGKRPFLFRNEARADIGVPPIDGWDEEDKEGAESAEQNEGGAGGGTPGSMNPSVMPAPSTTRGTIFGTEKKARIRPEEFPELLEAIRELATPAMTETMDRYFELQKDKIVARLLSDIDDPGTANPDSARGALPRLR